MPQPKITTTRLILRPLTSSSSHINLFVDLDASPIVMKYLENEPLTPAQATADHASRLDASTKVDGLGYWVGYLDDKIIGWFSLAPTVVNGAVEATQAEIGYRLLPGFWRQGYAKEGARALMKYGFDELRLHEVWGQTMSVNAASRGTMSACGMQLVRRFWVDFEDPVPGTEEGEVEYRIGRDKWEDLADEKRRF
ncbi:acetyltransferase (GNAT) domain-containing protein [Pochonia chlamydosporia 170]|uniref:Acetyltransferase (GNAT) domain-containing protein n=1 Tax=Pochonia chlamydosporia 170 TaxID=1380566 RepID=A0A179G902_METCM|nr:acetyltransferase (GNAT) domain-containing protein [Pochonia chlamydosporia 170]OAQ74287.1 acetyltransferase (GNAT) domain-containing protein [Pochonia chlamydosporia 170]